jgi:hypothetical protein
VENENCGFVEIVYSNPFVAFVLGSLISSPTPTPTPK